MFMEHEVPRVATVAGSKKMRCASSIHRRQHHQSSICGLRARSAVVGARSAERKRALAPSPPAALSASFAGLPTSEGRGARCRRRCRHAFFQVAPAVGWGEGEQRGLREGAVLVGGKEEVVGELPPWELSEGEGERKVKKERRRLALAVWNDSGRRWGEEQFSWWGLHEKKFGGVHLKLHRIMERGVLHSLFICGHLSSSKKWDALLMPLEL